MRSTPTCSANTASNDAASTSRGTRVETGGAERAAVAMVRAAHAVMPRAKIHTRAVPRSRIVARSARYSSCSRGVLPITILLEKPIPRHCGTGFVKGSGRVLDRMRFMLGRRHNSLAIYALYAKLHEPFHIGTTTNQGLPA